MDAIVAEVLRLDLLGKLALATFLGGVIGWEREASGKAAGLRTNILICVGAALLTELSIHFSTIPDGVPRWDPARISAQIVSGIGFLGAGTILQSKGTVTGLTTAATLWVVAAIGMSAGAGTFVEATGTTLLVLVVLWPLGWVEDRIEGARRGRIVKVVLEEGTGRVDHLQRLLDQAGLVVTLRVGRQSAGGRGAGGLRRARQLERVPRGPRRTRGSAIRTRSVPRLSSPRRGEA